MIYVEESARHVMVLPTVQGCSNAGSYGGVS